MTPAVRPETPQDHEAIRQVTQLAFGRAEEARLVDALRDEGHARLSLVAEQHGRIVGHALFSDLSIVSEGLTIPALSLAPMAVIPAHQRQGIGSMLVREGLSRCRADGHRIVVVLGHPAFYPRFGFSPTLTETLKSPFPGPAFMAVELVPGALENLEGEVRYPPPFGDL